MERRSFLKATISCLIACSFSTEAVADVLRRTIGSPLPHADSDLSVYLQKMKYFKRPHPDDRYLDPEKYAILTSTVDRLKRLQRTVGYGNFHLIGFDDAITMGRSYVRVGQFTKDELNFLEWLFYQDAARYGFMGEKPLARITDAIKVQRVVKVEGAGNYLYKGKPLKLYNKMKKDIGESLVLTSGVRSIVKQTTLFLNKTEKSCGNLSLASRSLAPPGFSYHGVGDFDVGQVGFGVANFTERFATTDVFKRIQDLGYAKLRYYPGNLLGVQFEPWHVRVDASVL